MSEQYWVVRYKAGRRGGSKALAICTTLRATRTASISACIRGFNESWSEMKKRVGLEVVKVWLSDQPPL